MDWETLKADCLACSRCELCKTRTNVVFGQGVPDAEVLFVGEGPGQSEDEQGLPFVGRSGQLLDKYLFAIDLDREKNCYIANIVKCRPPQNRDPLPAESDESADAQLASIQVQMDNLKKNISDCTVTSPMTGVIATRGVEKGSFASQAAPAYTVMDLSTIKVEVSVSEQVLNTIQVGDKVSVLMTAASETPLTGTVATIAPAAEQTGMYTVKVELDNKDGKIKSGMMAEVSFTMAASDDTILLPRNAVIEKDNETYVYLINNGKAKKTAVELGIEAEDTIEIKSGLKKGDNVVTKGQTYLSDGEEVTIANTAAKTKEKTKTTEKGE